MPSSSRKPVKSAGLSSKNFTCLDLFAGCGGMTLGLSWATVHRSSIRCIGAIDKWQPAVNTFNTNFCVHAACQSVSRLSVSAILDRVGGVDIVVGGPPCQGFSSSGSRALTDPRNKLVKAFLDAVELAAPQAFVMENVTGFTTFQSGRLLSEVVAKAKSLGFFVYPAIVLASRFGVPQRRRRFFLVGERTGTFQFPRTTPGDATGNQQLLFDQRSDLGFAPISFDDATSDLSCLLAGQRVTNYRCPPSTPYQRWARSNAMTVAEHFAPAHSADFVEMMSYIPPGKSAFDPQVYKNIPKRLRPTSGFVNSYARIVGSDPAPTITRNFTTPSSANCIHPHQDRALSIREGARCQSFPDSFVFTGSASDRRLQIGNAVPPLLAQALGVALLKSLATPS